MAKRRGRKANLSPRVPALRKVSKLFVEKKLPDGTTRREVKHQNYATPAVLEALGWKRPVSNAAEAAIEVTDFDELISAEAEEAVMAAATLDFDEEMALHDISTHIHHVVAHYISDARSQQAPKEFRPGAEAFHKVLKAAVAKFPSPGSTLAEALNLKLEKLTPPALEKLGLEDNPPDVDSCRSHVLALLEAAGGILADEAGKGDDADRAKRLLVAGLAEIYEKYTGRAPAKGYAPIKGKPAGPFFRFVTAVNEQLPDDLRLSDIDSLIRAHLRQ
jgi:hypothetical protein